ncbi:MAG: Zn-ribbon domain-containing OB-fold protein [Streptosporangiaceae bacterium]
MTGSRQIPVAEGLFTWPADEPRLIGARCAGCGLVGFPAGPACQRCGGTEVTQTLLKDRGTLWTFTTQNFRPPSPPYDGTEGAETFLPYALGYVELPGEVMVEARLTESDPARLAIGQPMRLVIVPYTVQADGTEVLTFAFAPFSPGGAIPPRPRLLTGGLPAPPYPPGPANPPWEA